MVLKSKNNALISRIKSSFIVFIFTVLCAYMPVHAEPVETTFGGESKDGIRKMITAKGGGFLLAGWQDQQGIHETGTGIIMSVDEQGAKRWARTLNTNGRNQASSLMQRSDGSIVAALEEYPGDAEQGQVVLFELTSDGDIIDSHSVGGIGSDVADAIVQTADGGYLIAGESSQSKVKNMDAWIAKLSPKFEVQWQWRKGTEGRDRFNDLHLLEDGSVIAAGNTTRERPDGKLEQDAWIVKFSPEGREIWTTIAGLDAASSIRDLLPAADGGIVFAGFTRRQGSREFDAWIGKLSLNGEILWEHSLDLTGNDYLHSISVVSEDNYLAAGSASGVNGAKGSDALVIEFSADGSVIESHRYERLGAEQVRVVHSFGDDEFVLVGAIRTPDNMDDEQIWFSRTKL